MAIVLTLMRQRNAVSAQRSVTDTTNELLTQNASMLKKTLLKRQLRMSVASLTSKR